ncbi:sperm-specific sodium:proton exchanger-like isoform X2 [Styela clava]
MLEVLGNETLLDNNGTLNGTNVTLEEEDPHGGHTGHHQPTTILFVFGCCGVGAILRILLRKWANFVSQFEYGSLMKLPYTVFLMLVGMLLAGIASHAVEVQPFLLSDMDPELFLHVFLPVVIFESAYVIDTHVFWRSIGHVALLSVPGLMVSTMLTAMLSFLVPEIGNIVNFEARLYIAILFGAIISATDPVAVVALLKELGNQKYLGTIIEGEALLNDGAAIVVFKIFLEMLKSTTPHFPDMTGLTTFQLVMQQSFLGPVMGFLFAKVAGFILGYIYNDALAEITVTLSFTYLTFYFGEWAKTSGVLAVVVFGLALDRASITPQVDHFLHRFWEMLAYLANTLIFVIVGIQITKFMGDISWYDVGYLLVIYVGITIIRAISIFSFFPLMTRLGIELNWRHVLVMTWGGLRGAVGLALAIYLNSYVNILAPPIDVSTFNLTQFDNVSPNITMLAAELESTGRVSDLIEPQTLSIMTEDEVDFQKVFQKILLHTGGIVLLTLLINASTIEAFLDRLGMLAVTTAQQLTMLNAVNRIQLDIKRSVSVLKYDRFLADARWSIVHEMTQISYPYKEYPTSGAVAAGGWSGQGRIHPARDGEVSPDEVKMSKSEDQTFKDLFEEARLRLIKALKMSYWKQYSNGMLTDQEARVLVSAADTAADKPGEFVNVDTIRKCWQVKGFLPWFKSKLEDMQYGKKIDTMQPPGRSRQIKRLFRIVRSGQFEIVMQMVILINIFPIIMDFLIDETWENADQWLIGLQLTNYVFIIIYCVEAGMKFVGLGAKQYFSDKWNWFDILILAICFIEIIIDMVIVDATAATGSIAKTVKTTKVVKFSKVAKSLRMLRATRILRLSKTIIPKTIDFINKQINKRLSFGYDVGKGFVAAEEEVSKLIVSISENRGIQEKLMTASNENRLTVIREMGLLQRDHPGIAISVKTKSAVRTILNQTRDTIYQLCAGGVLDEIETQLLERGVEVKLKKQVPSFVPPPPPEDLLENIPWMLGDSKILAFIRSHCSIMDYDYGDIIMQEGDEVDGIHIVVYGMIRLHGGLHGQIQLFRLQAPARSDDSGQLSGVLKQKNRGDQEDFLCSGNIIGEIGLLTGSARTCTVTCETAVQTFFIAAEDMHEAFSQFPQLKKAMWHVVAIRISAPLYMEHIQYQGTSVEQIHLHLSRGKIVELTEAEHYFEFSDSVEEVSVIHGSVSTALTGETIESPALLMPEHDTIHLVKSKFAILLVIPRDHGLGLDLVRSDTRSLVKHNSKVASLARLSGTVGIVPSCDVTMD